MNDVLKTDLPGLKLNGYHSQVSSDSDWRERAIQRALSVEARDGDGTDALVAAARTHLPGCVTLIQWLEIERVLEFVNARAGGWRSLTSGRSLYGESDTEHEIRLYTGWFVFQWEGHDVEVALCPSRYHSTNFVVVGADEGLLRALAGALVEFALRPSGRCLKFSGGWESAPEMEAAAKDTRWEDIILDPELLRAVRESVEGFVSGRQAYKALGFAWRRGILLAGPPGTGKTMICKAVAAALPEWPLLYVRSLSGRCQDDTIRNVFSRARDLAPCLLVFEDIDGMIDNENRTIFLNELDGFRCNDGILILASSNHPGKIDEALLKRPSRFDRVFHVGLPKKPERAAYCRYLLARSELAAHLTADFDAEDLAERAAARSEGFTPAFLKEAFTAAALSRAHSGAMTLDAEFAEAVLAEIGTLKAQIKRSRDPEAMAIITGGGDRMGLRRTA